MGANRMKQYVTKGISEKGTDRWSGQEVATKQDVKVGADTTTLIY